MRKTDVLGDVYENGTGATCAGDIKRLAHCVRQLFDVSYQEVVLDAGSRDANRVTFLKSIFTNGVRRHLSTDDDHRDGVHIGGCDACDGVCHTRAAGDQANTDFIGRARIGVGRMHCGLLVSHQNMFEFVLLVDRVVDI